MKSTGHGRRSAREARSPNPRVTRRPLQPRACSATGALPPAGVMTPRRENGKRSQTERQPAEGLGQIAADSTARRHLREGTSPAGSQPGLVQLAIIESSSQGYTDDIMLTRSCL